MRKRTKNELIGVAVVTLVLVLAWSNKYYAENIAPINEAKQKVILQLNDPGSAEFYNVTAFKYTNSVCGEVNAKNAMGGYVGRRRFVYNTLAHTVAIDEPELDKERLFEKLQWNTLCNGL